MAKEKTIFFCKECGTEVSKWQGQCPGCHQWNTLVEALSVTGGKKAVRSRGTALSDNRPEKINEIETQQETRRETGMKELDRVLGGGIVPGSLILVGGDPGIGKSTLLLQTCRLLSQKEEKVLYVSGEESARQIKMRAERIGTFEEEMLLFCETDLDAITSAILKTKPEFAVIDSIQTMYSEDLSSAAGSVSQVREVTAAMLSVANENNIAVFIVGHVTKEGVVAGPRTLEHMVDTVLYFEGEREAAYRILRGVKNRFGSTNEIGVFEMCNNGLVEVENPSKTMLNGRPLDASGSVVVCSMEGTRPILIEIQALVSPTSFQMPRRTAVGIDYNRVNLLMAVLEKRVGLQLGGCDAYVNLAGGMKLGEPAIASSYKNRAILEDTIIFGEVGLVGEVRAVSGGEARIKEAQKLGFKRCILPQANVDQIKIETDMRLVGVSNVMEALVLI